MFDKFKDKLQNFDLNTLSTSIIATFGAATTQDLIQASFTTLTVISAIWSLVLSKHKDSIENEKNVTEMQSRKEAAAIEIEFRKAELERYRKETERLNEENVAVKINFNELKDNE